MKIILLGSFFVCLAGWLPPPPPLFSTNFVPNNFPNTRQGSRLNFAVGEEKQSGRAGWLVFLLTFTEPAALQSPLPSLPPPQPSACPERFYQEAPLRPGSASGCCSSCCRRLLGRCHLALAAERKAPRLSPLSSPGLRLIFPRRDPVCRRGCLQLGHLFLLLLRHRPLLLFPLFSPRGLRTVSAAAASVVVVVVAAAAPLAPGAVRKRQPRSDMSGFRFQPAGPP